MLDLATNRDPRRMSEYPGVDDLVEMFSGVPGIQAKAHLWEDTEGHLAAYAIEGWVAPFEIARSYADNEQAVAQVLSWCVERARQTGEPAIVAHSWVDDQERIALLERHGFVRQPWQQGLQYMERSLHEPIPSPHMPPGYAIRHVAGEHEVEALVDLHRAAFDTEWMTVQYRLAMMRVPDYDPALDLLAVAPDGSLAALTVCGLNRQENALSGRNVGHTDPVATHPAHRRKGLARALLLTGFQLLKTRGMDVAAVGTWSENTAMVRAAQSVGYRVQTRRITLKKPI
jgi:ribosomal protein S18 acetylase RimI-like enzyme